MTRSPIRRKSHVVGPVAWLRVPLVKAAPAVPSSIQFPRDEDVWHLTLDQIEADTGRIVNPRIAPASAAGPSTYIFDDTNVLYSKLRPYLNKVVRPRSSGVATAELVPLRPRQGVLIPDFLAYYLRSPHFVAFASNCTAGTKMPRVIMSKLWEHEIPLPSPSEQLRIVEILDQANRLRRLRVEADAKVDRILSAVFIKMFGDPVANPMGWPVLPLKAVGQLDRGRSRHRPRNDPKLLGGPYPFIQTGDVASARGVVRHYTSTYSELGLAQSRLWPAGTLCITIAANIAACAILGFDACFPDSIVGFSPDEQTNAAYIRILLTFKRASLEQLAPQMAQKNINLEALRELLVPVPPKAQQDAFARHHDSVLGISAGIEKSSEGLQRAWEAMMYDAFSGKLTASWRKTRRSELLQEMEHQAKTLTVPTLSENSD